MAPNLIKGDVACVLPYLVFPWKWKSWYTGPYGEVLRLKLAQLFPERQIILTDSGRSALELYLRAMGIGKGDEVIVQAYTCLVVPLAIKAVGATPVFADIDPIRLTMDPKSLESCVGTHTKAVIVQHTFGMPADMVAIKEVLEKKKILIIEDCAHVLDGKTGLSGDAAIVSFGTDKPISAVRGGALILKETNVAEKVATLLEGCSPMTCVQLARHLFQPLLFRLALPLYDVCSLGKGILALAKKIHILPLVLSPSEKQGNAGAPAPFPDALAALAVHQMHFLEEKNQWRRKLHSMYKGHLEAMGLQIQKAPEQVQWTPLRTTILSPRRDALVAYLKKKGIVPGDWYSTVIAPKDTVPTLFGYCEGSCPHAEKAAQQSLNLPLDLRISIADGKKILQKLRQALSTL